MRAVNDAVSEGEDPVSGQGRRRLVIMSRDIPVIFDEERDMRLVPDQEGLDTFSDTVSFGSASEAGVDAVEEPTAAESPMVCVQAFASFGCRGFEERVFSSSSPLEDHPMRSKGAFR